MILLPGLVKDVIGLRTRIRENVFLSLNMNVNIYCTSFACILPTSHVSSCRRDHESDHDIPELGESGCSSFRQKLQSRLQTECPIVLCYTMKRNVQGIKYREQNNQKKRIIYSLNRARPILDAFYSQNSGKWRHPQRTCFCSTMKTKSVEWRNQGSIKRSN